MGLRILFIVPSTSVGTHIPIGVVAGGGESLDIFKRAFVGDVVDLLKCPVDGVDAVYFLERLRECIVDVGNGHFDFLGELDVGEFLRVLLRHCREGEADERDHCG